MRGAMATAGMMLLCSCGGGDGGGRPTPSLIAVGGDYSLAVALTENDCGSVTVQPLPTHVDHAAGATAFRLTHGPNTFDGTVAGGGSFTTAPRTLDDGAGGTLTLAIAGRFSTTGLDALATVTLPRPCRYVVHWTGTKQGPPNVIP